MRTGSKRKKILTSTCLNLVDIQYKMEGLCGLKIRCPIDIERYIQ